jgi:hypothetical protein
MLSRVSYLANPLFLFFDNEMVFKIDGDIHIEALSLDGSKLFDPSKKNRPMKEWVQVPYDYHEHWERFAIDAFKLCQ